MGVTSFRLDDELLKKLEEVSKKKHIDRSTALKQILEIGLQKLKLEEALVDYQNGKISAWRASHSAEIPLWRFLEILKQRRIPFKTADSEMEEMLNEL